MKTSQSNETPTVAMDHDLIHAAQRALNILATINGSYLTHEKAQEEPYSWGETRRLSFHAQGLLFEALKNSK